MEWNVSVWDHLQHICNSKMKQKYKLWKKLNNHNAEHEGYCNHIVIKDYITSTVCIIQAYFIVM